MNTDSISNFFIEASRKDITFLEQKITSKVVNKIGVWVEAGGGGCGGLVLEHTHHASRGPGAQYRYRCTDKFANIRICLCYSVSAVKIENNSILCEVLLTLRGLYFKDIFPWSKMLARYIIPLKSRHGHSIVDIVVQSYIIT